MELMLGSTTSSIVGVATRVRLRAVFVKHLRLEKAPLPLRAALAKKALVTRRLFVDTVCHREFPVLCTEEVAAMPGGCVDACEGLLSGVRPPP